MSMLASDDPFLSIGTAAERPFPRKYLQSKPDIIFIIRHHFLRNPDPRYSTVLKALV